MVVSVTLHTRWAFKITATWIHIFQLPIHTCHGYTAMESREISTDLQWNGTIQMATISHHLLGQFLPIWHMRRRSNSKYCEIVLLEKSSAIKFPSRLVLGRRETSELPWNSTYVGSCPMFTPKEMLYFSPALGKRPKSTEPKLRSSVEYLSESSANTRLDWMHRGDQTARNSISQHFVETPSKSWFSNWRGVISTTFPIAFKQGCWLRRKITAKHSKYQAASLRSSIEASNINIPFPYMRPSPSSASELMLFLDFMHRRMLKLRNACNSRRRRCSRKRSEE